MTLKRYAARRDTNEREIQTAFVNKDEHEGEMDMLCSTSVRWHSRSLRSSSPSRSSVLS